MLTVQYTGERERTVGVSVVYPGELMQATLPMLQAWRAEHGDLFTVVGAPEAPEDAGAGAVVVGGEGAAHVFASVGEADGAVQGKRGRGK